MLINNYNILEYIIIDEKLFIFYVHKESIIVLHHHHKKPITPLSLSKNYS